MKKRIAFFPHPICLAVILIAAGATSCEEPVAKEHAPYLDGTYTAALEPDSYQYVANATITVTGAIITNVIYFEQQEGTGQLKDENYYSRNYIFGSNEQYSDEWYNSAQYVVAAIRRYTEELLDVQDPNKVSAISGASHSYRRFVEVTNEALSGAQE